MGLLEKADAFARAKSLLHRSLELLSEGPPPEPEVPASEAPASEPPALEPEPATDDLSAFDVPVFQVRVENPETPPAVEPAALATPLLEAASALETTLDLPSRLFGLLKERPGIAKGALLLRDAERGVFAPWAACGYDPATLRRLRIPIEEPALSSLARSGAVEVSDPKSIADLHRFFSSRESGTIERLSFAPLAADGNLLGVLLVTDPSPLPPGTLETLARVAAAAVPALACLRDEILRPAGGPTSPREARDDLSRFLAAQSDGARPFTVFSLSLERCRRRVIAANPWLDPFRLEEDLRTVVSTFTADLGRAVHLGRLRFLVAVRELGTSDTELFAHQLATLLGSLFHATVFEPADAEIGTARGFPSGTDATPAAAAELLATLAAS